MSIASRQDVLSPSRKEQARFHLRWVLAHEPVSLFEPAARRFSQLVEEGTGGEVRVDVLSLCDYAPGRRLAMGDVQEELRSGRLMMAQLPCVDLGRWHAPFWGLESPFIFRSHEHASRVLDGRIGQGLLDALRPKGLRGLAFTYSGGERILSTAGREIRRVEDLAGLRVRICHTPVAEATMQTLGAQTVQAPVAQITQLTREGRIDAAESTWARYWDQRHDAAQPVVHETSHTFLLTSIVLQERIFQSLPSRYREVLVESARTIASQERQYSLQQAGVAREAATTAGVKIVAFDAGERERFETRARQAHARIRSLVGGELLDAVAAAA